MSSMHPIFRWLPAAVILVLVAGLPQLFNGGFEQTPDATGIPGWNVGASDVTVLDAAVGGPDLGMPVDGAQWVSLSASGSFAATGPSNPGGIGIGPIGAAQLSQSFSLTGNQTRLAVSAVLLSDEDSAGYADFVSVDVSDGFTTINLLYTDTTQALPHLSNRYDRTLGGPMPASDVVSASIDLVTAFPGADTNTVFDLRFCVGNAGDGSLPSRGYFDSAVLSVGPSIPMGVLATDIRFETSNGTTTRLISESGSHGGAEIFNLFSTTTSQPVGGGPLLGLYPDGWTYISAFRPLGAGPFHVHLNPAGHYHFDIPTGLVTGLTVDVLMVILQSGSVVDVAGPVRHTF